MSYGWPFDLMDDAAITREEAEADEDRAQRIADRHADHAPAPAIDWATPMTPAERDLATIRDLPETS